MVGRNSVCITCEMVSPVLPSGYAVVARRHWILGPSNLGVECTMSFGLSGFPGSLRSSEHEDAVDTNRLEDRSVLSSVAHSFKHPREKNTKWTYWSIPQRIPPEAALSSPPSQLFGYSVQPNALYWGCMLPGDQRDSLSALDMCES